MNTAVAAANKLDEYAEWTNTVAKYPVTAESYYLSLGMTDEFAEAAQKIYAAPRIAKDALEKEFGDVLWYCARYSVNVLGEQFSRTWQAAKQTSAAAPVNMPAMAVMIVAVGQLAGYEKKKIRDGDLWSPEQQKARRDVARLALVDFMAGLFSMCRSHRIDPVDAIKGNMEKLTGRDKAGTLRGDGDNR